MRTFLHGLFARLGPPSDGDPGDDQLLSAFVSSRDETAFQHIVRRHGPMVHGVCRRVLGNETDADDAFQAVFLVFLRKADTVRPGNMLGNWLYGVAVNVARKGRELNARRKVHELASVQGTPANSECQLGGNADLREVLDQELSRLPADYRAAVVACDLEGRTRREAAVQLGWNEGTVASRLARARSLLADRLTRRGFALPAAGLATIAAPTAVAALPVALFTGHTLGIESLAHEAMRAMTASKVKGVAAVVLAVAGLSGIGVGVVTACGGFDGPPASPAKPAPEAKANVGVPKPAAAGSAPAAAKPTRFTLTNPNKDITVVSDRDESFVEFFRRQKVMVAGLNKKEFEAAVAAREPSEKLFVDNSSQNQDGFLNAVYGAYVRLAPISRAVAAVIPEPGTGAVVLVADAKRQDLWHVVGFTTRSSVGFFASKEKKGADDFAPADLIHPTKK